MYYRTSEKSQGVTGVESQQQVLLIILTMKIPEFHKFFIT